MLCYLERIITSFRRMIARSRGQRPVMKIHKCAMWRRAKHNGKAHNKNTTWPRATPREWIYARAPREQAKWLPLEFCIFVKMLFYKKHLINQVTLVLRRSLGLLDQFITIWKSRTGHTHTPNYCNPATHAHRRLIITGLQLVDILV